MWIVVFLIQVESLLHNDLVIVINVIFTQIQDYSVC